MSYQPISCSLHDRLEAACVRGRPVEILWSAGLESAVYRGLIRDVRVVDGAEFLILDESPPVRLDWIESFEEE